MVAIPGALELQVPEAIVDENKVVSPTHTFWVPPNVPGFGGAVTVTVRVTTASEQGGVPATV